MIDKNILFNYFSENTKEIEKKLEKKQKIQINTIVFCFFIVKKISIFPTRFSKSIGFVSGEQAVGKTVFEIAISTQYRGDILKRLIKDLLKLTRYPHFHRMIRSKIIL